MLQNNLTALEIKGGFFHQLCNHFKIYTYKLSFKLRDIKMKMTHSKKQIFANLNNCGSFVYATNRLNGEALAIGNPASIAFTPPPLIFSKLRLFIVLLTYLIFPLERANSEIILNILIY